MAGTKFDQSKMELDLSKMDGRWSDTFHDSVAQMEVELDPVQTRSITKSGVSLDSSDSNLGFGRRDVINRTLRYIYPKEGANKVHRLTDAPKTNTEVDHFFEIQHVVVVFLAWMDDQKITDMSLPFGAYVDVSAWVNSPENLFVVSDGLNQSKKSIPMSKYATNQSILTYLKSTVILPQGGTSNVASVISRLLYNAIVWEGPWRNLIRFIADGLNSYLPKGWEKLVISGSGLGAGSGSSTSTSTTTSTTTTTKETLLSTNPKEMPKPPSSGPSTTTTMSPSTTSTPMQTSKTTTTTTTSKTTT